MPEASLSYIVMKKANRNHKKQFANRCFSLG
jgi:hypothetical protein